jgi:hypothetical protein
MLELFHNGFESVMVVTFDELLTEIRASANYMDLEVHFNHMAQGFPLLMLKLIYP